MTRLEVEREATAEAFHLLPMGLMLTDERGDIALLNAAAEEILTRRDGLSVMKRRLVAAVPAEGGALSRLIAQATSVTAGREIRGGGATQVSRAGGKQPLTLLVTPLRSTNRYAPPGRAGAAIFITDQDRHPQTSHEVLIQLHRLTPAESRLACLLAGGLTFADALEMLGITANTGRGTSPQTGVDTHFWRGYHPARRRQSRMPPGWIAEGVSQCVVCEVFLQSYLLRH